MISGHKALAVQRQARQLTAATNIFLPQHLAALLIMTEAAFPLQPSGVIQKVVHVDRIRL